MKTIFITGASKGIGYATVLELAKNKENKIFALARNFEELVRLKDHCQKEFENEIVIIPQDINSIKTEFIKTFIKDEPIDILINNAGFLIKKPFLESTIEDWKNQFDTNFFSVVNLIKILFLNLQLSKGAHIVNIGSMAGYQSSKKYVGLSAYSASKAALSNLTETLAEEFKTFSIRCNCLCFGGVETDMFRKAFPNAEQAIDTTKIAQFIAQFSLTANQTMNGKIIPVSLSTP